MLSALKVSWKKIFGACGFAHNLADGNDRHGGSSWPCPTPGAEIFDKHNFLPPGRLDWNSEHVKHPRFARWDFAEGHFDL